MSKDPAFLFYPNDYIGGTMGMTFEEKGAYMELLMLQFNRGHMTSHMIGQTIGQLFGQIKDKFKVDADGLYYNQRLDDEIKKRQEYVASRINNKSGVNQHTGKRGHMTSHMTSHMIGHMVNVNVNENIDDISKSRKKSAEKKPSIEKPIKSAYGSQNNVMLTHDELDRLRAKFPDDADDAIEYLSKYIAEKGYKSASHNLAIQRWVIDAVKERKVKTGNAGGKKMSEVERILNL